MISKLARLRAVPWLMLFEAARVTHGHVKDVTSPADRRRVMEIVRSAKGNPLTLSERDRADLKRIAGKLDLKQLAASFGPSLLSARHRR